MKNIVRRLIKHPPAVLYAVLLGFVAFSAAVPMFAAGMYDAALTDLAMAGILIAMMLKTFVFALQRKSSKMNKIFAWLAVIAANILALLPTHDFPGSLSTAFAFSLLICAAVLYFSGPLAAAMSLAPALWCCVFMPYHEEFMLLLSYPLRLSAAMLSTLLLKLCGINVIYAGTSLSLPGLSIAITDACSGINQLDAFILIAFGAVQLMHKKMLWKILHFSFIIPAVIIGNSLRIFITVLLFKMLGEKVLENVWHIALGYTQIIFALLIFLAIGRIFCAAGKNEEEQK